jgi:hypothetical protein
MNINKLETRLLFSIVIILQLIAIILLLLDIFVCHRDSDMEKSDLLAVDTSQQTAKDNPGKPFPQILTKLPQ